MRQNQLIRPKNTVLVAFLLPGVLLFCFSVILPLLISLRFSLYKWSGGAVMEYIGLQNYLKLIHDTEFWMAFKNNLYVIVLCSVGQIGIAFILTAFMTSRFLMFREFSRIVIFMPVVLSAVVVGLLWSVIYNSDSGLLNWLLRQLGLSHLIRPWLNDPKSVMFFVTVPIIWQYIGFYLVIFMSAVQGIPRDIYESAETDGATGIKKTIYITLPLMYETLKVALMVCIAGNMKIFDNILVMTAGGPGSSSTVLAMYAYKTSFTLYKLGYGSAVSNGILILSAVLILSTRKLMARKVYVD